MTLWEYRVTSYTDDKTMQDFGKQGWELVAVSSSPNGEGRDFYWKRALR